MVGVLCEHGTGRRPYLGLCSEAQSRPPPCFFFVGQAAATAALASAASNFRISVITMAGVATGIAIDDASAADTILSIN